MVLYLIDLLVALLPIGLIPAGEAGYPYDSGLFVCLFCLFRCLSPTHQHGVFSRQGGVWGGVRAAHLWACGPWDEVWHPMCSTSSHYQEVN